MHITLTREQIEYGKAIGTKRAAASRSHGDKDVLCRRNDGLTADMQGACGEYAAAIALFQLAGLELDPKRFKLGVNTYNSQPDVKVPGHGGFEIKSTRTRPGSPHYGMTFSGKDIVKKTEPFVLVRMVHRESLAEWEVLGWTTANQACDWLSEGRATPSSSVPGRPLGIFVPAESLNDIRSLIPCSKNHAC